MIGAILSLALSLLLGATPATAQPGPAALTNLRCPGPDLSFDPQTQQIVSAWEDVVKYPVTLDDQGPLGVALDTNCNLYVAKAWASSIDPEPSRSARPGPMPAR